MNTLKNKYDKLSPGQKRILIKNYREQFSACLKTFYLKLNNTTILRKSEEIFFLNNL